MIFITYKTTELQQYKKKSSKKKYEEINDFLSPISIVKEEIKPETIKKIVTSVNDESEQIYYEPVKEKYEYNKDLDFIDFWSQLFDEINKKIETAYKNNTITTLEHIKLIIVNQSEILGQWQSVEVLSAIRHGAHLFWISVDDLLAVINKVKEKREKNDRGGKQQDFLNELRKKCKAIYPNKHERL